MKTKPDAGENVTWQRGRWQEKNGFMSVEVWAVRGSADDGEFRHAMSRSVVDGVHVFSWSCVGNEQGFRAHGGAVASDCKEYIDSAEACERRRAEHHMRKRVDGEYRAWWESYVGGLCAQVAGGGCGMGVVS